MSFTASRSDSRLTQWTVVARFRPQNKIELAYGGEPVVEFQNDDTCTINVRDLWKQEENKEEKETLC